MSLSQDSKSRLNAIAIVAIIALLAINAFLLINKFGQDKELKAQATQLHEVEEIKTELQKQYYEALTSLEELKGDNGALNARIDSQKVALKNQKDEISATIRGGKAEMKVARARIHELVAQSERYIAEISELSEQNTFLTSENMKLGEEKRILQDEISKEREQTQMLVSEKMSLEETNSKLNKERSSLKKTVDKATVIDVQNVEAIGYKIREGDKLVRKRYANNIDVVKICFDTKSNELANAGPETFYIRVLTPSGETMAMDNLGSGTFQLQEDGSVVRYTKAQELDYSHTEMTSCVNWTPGVAFSKGTYNIEVYNKGYLCGASTFRLK